MSAPLDIDQLHTFIAIVDTGSFTKAADRVFKTQSAVSMQMRRLEERLGKQLFAKDGRGNRLTAEGEKLMHYARRIIRLNNEAVAAFDDNRLEGTLRIGTPDDYADRYMPEIIGRFAKTHPNVELYIVCEPSISLAEKMARGELDIALVTHNPRTRVSDIVRTEPLCWVTSQTIHCVTMRPCRLPSGDATATGGSLPARLSMPTGATIRSSSPAGLHRDRRCSSCRNGRLGSPESTLRTGMRVLTSADGFPPLPPVQIG